MRIVKYLILIISIIVVACGVYFGYKYETSLPADNHTPKHKKQKVLVAYFSRVGEQYAVGFIIKGNTQIVAEMIAKRTGGDLFEIKPAQDNYPLSYIALKEYAKQESQRHARPKLADTVKDFDKYDVIFLGYPNWWDDMPMPVHTFLESYDFSKKKVYHFCTHEGTGSVVDGGLAIFGHTAQRYQSEAKKSVDEWLDKLGF